MPLLLGLFLAPLAPLSRGRQSSATTESPKTVSEMMLRSSKVAIITHLGILLTKNKSEKAKSQTFI